MCSNVFLFGNLLAVVSLLAACSPNSQESTTQASNSHSTTVTEQQPEAIATSANDLSPIFFDDFSYRDMAAFNQNGWKARTETGHPGIAGATWSAEGIAFLESLEGAENGAVRMSSVTGGSGENTRHTQFCHARKYREGTYAARVFFRDQPAFGPDGDEVIQTFYAISPLKAPMDKDYSETDFEYLPNGGWGEPNDPAMWTTSWDTFQLEPWTKVNEYTRVAGSYAGWHTLVLTVADNKVTYFVDGKLFSEHSNAVYPEDFMSMNFNLWFMPKGADGSQGPVESAELREYQEDIDWAFHMADRALSTAEVETLVTDFRKNKIAYVDRVAEQNPPLPSPCGL